MAKGEFHFIYNTDKYDSTVAFYRDGLDLPIIAAWDEGPEDRGTVFRVASGIVEVMAHPTSRLDLWSVYSPNLPQGVNLAFEVEDVKAWFQRAQEKELEIHHELVDFNWGQRGFALREPNGLVVFIYSPIVTGLDASVANLAG
jgi:catechol 2,3-dioxygenase-like lactoylglutathione lyase family enzyme